MKVVRNERYGGFGLSKKACERLTELTGKEVKPLDYNDTQKRTAPELIQVIEELGRAASGQYA